MDLFNLFAKIGLDDSGFTKGLTENEKKMSKFSQELSKTFTGASSISNEARQKIVSHYSDIAAKATESMAKLTAAFERGEISVKEFEEQSSKLKNEFNEANQKVNDFSDKSGKSVSSWSSKVGVAFKAAGKAILAIGSAVATAAGAITGLLIKTEQYGDEIDKQSQKMGLSAEAYQKWAIAAEMAGTDAATLQTGIRQLTKFTQDLAEGTGESLLALQELGIGYDDFMNMSFDDQLKTVVEAMQGLEDSTKKAELAQHIFGNRAYQELMPLFNQEKGSLDELFASYEDMGLIMDDITVKKSAELNDKMTLLTKTFQMLGVQIGTEVYPQMELFIDGFQQILTGDFDKGIDKIGEAIVGLVQKAADALPQVLDILGSVVLKMLDMILQVIADPEFVQNLIKSLEMLLLKVIDMLPTMVGTIFDLLKALIEAIINIDWGTLIAHLLDALMDIVFVQLPNLVFDLVEMLLDLILSGKIFEIIAKIGIGIGQGIVNGIISIIESGINLIVKGINAIDFLGIIPDIPTLSLPRVKWLAGGGIMQGKGTAYIVGENGAEIVAQGAQGTGVTNVEQIEEAMYRANQRSNREMVVGIVNGIVQGLGRSGAAVNMPEKIVVQLGEREFKSAIVSATNSKQFQRGRKTLNGVTGY